MFHVAKIYINNKNYVEISIKSVADIYNYLTELMHLTREDFYLEQNGKRLYQFHSSDYPVYVRLCVFGGKGGFGSMLRAIGAQIEKTTNREACRDLSGRRIRDINEEKRLKAWLEKQGEREREAEERKKRKIEKLLAVPKHKFKDEEYENARSKLTEKVCNAVEEGFKKSKVGETNLKRKSSASTSQNAGPSKKKKIGLWLDDTISSSEDSDETDDSETPEIAEEKKNSNEVVNRIN